MTSKTKGLWLVGAFAGLIAMPGIICAKHSKHQKTIPQPWQIKACSIQNVLVIMNDGGHYRDESAMDNVKELTWMHPVLAVGGEGFHAKVPDGAKVDGTIWFEATYGGSIYDLGDSAVFVASGENEYRITLVGSDNKILWFNYRRYRVFHYKEVLEELNREAGCKK